MCASQDEGKDSKKKKKSPNTVGNRLQQAKEQQAAAVDSPYVPMFGDLAMVQGLSSPAVPTAATPVVTSTAQGSLPGK